MNCPKCDNTSIAEILWGYFTEMDELKNDLDIGKITLGGCIVTDHDPKWECNDCGNRWGVRED
jgi:hypothetical protein